MQKAIDAKGNHKGYKIQKVEKVLKHEGNGKATVLLSCGHTVAKSRSQHKARCFECHKDNREQL